MLAAASAAAAAAASTTTALACLRSVTFRTGMTVLLLFRLEPGRGSRHTVCLGTSSNGYCLVIVLHAVMTYDRSMGTREAGSVNFVLFTDPRGACTTMALSCKFGKSGSVSQIRGFDPRVNRKQLAGHDGLTRE